MRSAMDNGKKKQYKPNPKITANYLSRLSFWWLRKLFWLGKKHNLKANDLYDVLPENVSEPLGNELEISWENELNDALKKNRKPSLWKAIIKTFGWSFIKYGISMLVLHIVKILQPSILALLIWYFDPLSTTSMSEAYMYASGLILVTLLQTIIVRQAHLGQQEIGMRVTIACSSLIYRKVLKLRCTSASQAGTGSIINLLSNDLAKFEAFVLNLHYIWIMPFIVALITYLIWRQLGIAALAGILFMAAYIIPTQALWYKLTSKLRSKGAVLTDNRILLIGEIINGIRVIKMYAWEKSFEQLVYLARKHEINTLLKRCYVRSARVASSVFTHRTALFFTILVYVMRHNVISADRIFSTVHYFQLVRSIMSQFFPESVSLGAEVNVSVKRIEKFLLLEEIVSKAKPLKLSSDNIVIRIKEVKASWEKNSSLEHLCDINVSVPEKKLYAVIGPVGSGKSSLIKLILGELEPCSGEVSVYGNVSYASQEPWLFNGSVRDNILFGEPYDQSKYASVTRACALTKDFAQLPHGDKTLVGERGTSLSGGQCARVNLARAVYRDADVYLFDDPLSAVDTHVGKSLFQDCINGLLKGKTRILITHQVHYLREADTIILLNDGRIEFQGSFQSFNRNIKYLRHLPLNDEMDRHIAEEKIICSVTRTISRTNLDVDKRKETKPEETEEFLANGRVPMSLYYKYLKAGASYFTFVLLLVCFVFTQLSISGFDYWLAYWTKQEEKRRKIANSTSSVTVEIVKYLDENTFLSVSGALILGIILFANSRNFLFYKTVLNASKRIHNKMFANLVRAPIQFFNVNPSGRILNRFSKDTNYVDESLPNAMLDVTDGVLRTIGIIIQILMINWWTVFPMIVIVYLFIIINDLYLSTVQDIKRLEGNAKSPVFSLVNSSLMGLPTIRSCRAQKIVRKEFEARQDDHTAAHYLVMVTSSAFGFWLDTISISFLAFIAYSFIILKNSKTYAGDVGLALTQVITICGQLQFTMKQAAEVMTQMTSVERLIQFTKLDQEGPFDTAVERIPKPSWPNRGQIKFKNLCLRYSDEGEPVLKNLNFTIEPNMKIGIVGRTGAGKSSLIAALFRLAKIDGSLLIDSVDTKTIGLTDLRNKISIIPQESMLFTASLRDNLDPFHQYDDASLWSALEEVELNKLFESLDHSVDRGGSNLSSGQRQLLCLARAIVKKNKILVLDEATANVDPATDDLIQKTIRCKFKNCTVLTIAHRLNTIMDNDRVLVMDRGEVVEFDHPHELLERNDSYFTMMVQETGNSMSHHLRILAKKAFYRRLKTDSVTPVPNDQSQEIIRL